MRYLDQNGDASVPAGYNVVQAESEFLDHAFDSQIVVRGPKLCAWATLFWDGRNMGYQTLHSPIQRLRLYGPTMSDAVAREVLALNPLAEQRLIDATDLSGLLSAVFPSDLWQTKPSIFHGAAWLLWLDEQDPPVCVQSLLSVQAAFWQEQIDGAEKHPYGARNAVQARAILDQWLGIDETIGPSSELREFPLPIPDRIRRRIEESWTRRVVESRGLYFRRLLSRPLPFELKEEVTRISAEYFKNHPAELNDTIIQELSGFLSMEEKEALRDIVPPSEPPIPPLDASRVAAWFCDSYLPYRLWAINRRIETVDAVCRDRGTRFAKWFLEFYPMALAAGLETISFRRCGRVMCDRGQEVRLMIILDGIGIWDARELVRRLRVTQRRLALTKNDWCFAAIPTVTEICKPAMRQGVVPRNVNPAAYALDTDFVRLLENEDACEILRRAKPGEFYIWSLVQTDQTYHKVGDAKTIRDNIQTLLDGLSKRIGAAVQAVPNHLKLKVIITTDHGRFLGRSERTIPLSCGMVSHQRAAWGGSGNAKDLPGDFEILHGGRVARLHPERFGITQSALVAIGEDSFVNDDGSGGADWFPHGGVWPEEVIIPWLEFQRDAEPPHVAGRLVGKGVEGRDGEIEINLTNTSSLEVDVLSVSIEGDGLAFQWAIDQTLPSRDTETYIHRMSPWPSMTRIARLRARCVLRQPTGDEFSIDLELNLLSESMQKRHAALDDLL